jgi:ribosomal protein S18 acetylase RimI-like enzyme
MEKLLIEIRTYRHHRASELNQLTGPFTCDATYCVTFHDSEEHSSFELERVPLAAPYTHHYTHIDDEWVQTYLARADFSFGAYDGEQLVGVLIAEKRAWNGSMWVLEFHVAAERRGQGIGRMLMEHAAQQAVKAGLRVITCETQNRNANAIQAYRRLGFRVEGIDISYYTNHDYPGRDIAVFMKRQLDVSSIEP